MGEGVSNFAIKSQKLKFSKENKWIFWRGGVESKPKHHHGSRDGYFHETISLINLLNFSRTSHLSIHLLT